MLKYVKGSAPNTTHYSMHYHTVTLPVVWKRSPRPSRIISTIADRSEKMPEAPKPAKIQPWKAMKTLEEDVNPDLAAGLRLFQTGTGGGSLGAAVSKPMDRATANRGLQPRKQDPAIKPVE
ncbi:hypothetical protein F5Y07DRAFT_360389 [Xylaria sp. FL0933]|nr:hypothetical protein F5Y07DRAFT_360389 [Xylaria sp. FL0933]